MKSLFPFLFSLWYVYATIVINVPNEKDTFLSFDKNLEVGVPFTVCIRFKLEGYLTNRVIFRSKNDNFGLSLRPKNDIGWIGWAKLWIPFKIPKGLLQSYKWHHLCFALDKQSFAVIVDGQQWYKSSYENKMPEQTTFNQIQLGSMDDNKYKYIYEDFKGDLTELNIWDKALSKEKMIELTKTCKIANPAPDILNWSNDLDLYLSGGEDTSTIAMTHLCPNGDQTVEKHRIVQFLQNQDDAIHTCNILNGKLAYPITIDEFKTWKGRFYTFLVEAVSYKNNLIFPF
jgi:hypothetical protein